MKKIQNRDEDGFEEDNFSARSPHISNLSSLKYRTQSKGNNPKNMLYIIVALVIFNFIVYFYWESKHAALLTNPTLPPDSASSNLQADLLSTRGKL
jgi:hypothetical protein